MSDIRIEARLLLRTHRIPTPTVSGAEVVTGLVGMYQPEYVMLRTKDGASVRFKEFNAHPAEPSSVSDVSRAAELINRLVRERQ